MKNLLQMVTVKDAGLILEAGEGPGEQILAEYKAGKRREVRFTATVWNNGKNRNHVQLEDSELEAFAASFVGQPFLADHSRTLSDRGGTIVASELVDLGDGKKTIRQTVAARKPWAIEGVLDGTVDRFSIGWNAEEYVCTVCQEDYFGDDHRHSVWDLGRKDKKTGKVVEVLMKGLEGVETSAVTHPAVPGTGVADVMSDLAQARQCEGKKSGATSIPLEAELKPEGTMKDFVQRILVLLGLPADTAEGEALAAAEKRLTAPAIPEALAKALGIDPKASVDEAVARAYSLVPRSELDAAKAAAAERLATDLVGAGEKAGKITPGMKAWALEFATRDPQGFEKCLAGMPVQVITNQPPPVTTTPTPATAAEDEDFRRSTGLNAEEWREAKAAVASWPKVQPGQGQ